MWLFHMSHAQMMGMTHDSFMCVTWLMTHDSWLVDVCDMAHDSWLIDVCDTADL